MNNNKLVVFLGDVAEYLGEIAKNYDASAWLLDTDNLSCIDIELGKHDVVVYTSLGDLPKDLALVVDLLGRADTIYYQPPEEWSDGKILDITDPGSSIHGLTEIVLLLLPDSVNVKGLEPFSPLNHDPIFLVDQRQTDQKQLWIAGCSISHGVGVDLDQRYGNLLANDLNLKCSFLTRPGSSIDWAADQLLRSDIQKDDLVVWGLTNWSRYSYVYNHQLCEGITVNTLNHCPEYSSFINIKEINSHQTFYKNFYAIEQVINHCKKIGAQLFLVGLLHDSFSYLGFLKSQSNYIHIPYKLSYKDQFLSCNFLDLGTDNKHPGVQQHQRYKDIILDHISKAN